MENGHEETDQRGAEDDQDEEHARADPKGCIRDILEDIQAKVSTVEETKAKLKRWGISFPCPDCARPSSILNFAKVYGLHAIYWCNGVGGCKRRFNPLNPRRKGQGRRTLATPAASALDTRRQVTNTADASKAAKASAKAARIALTSTASAAARPPETVVFFATAAIAAANDAANSAVKATSWAGRSVPLELQMLILSWLSVEDILRLRLVCKEWASLLHDPHFRELWAQNSCHSVAKQFILLQYGHHIGYQYKNSKAVRTRYCKCLSRPGLQELPEVNWFTPKGSRGVSSAGGFMLCRKISLSKNKHRLWVGNPVTKQWVELPALEQSIRSEILVPYISEGLMFFRIYFDPYMFDSRVGIWTYPRYQTIYMYAPNILHMQGVQYGLGFWRRYNAIVLVEIDDLGALWEATWLYAWDFQKLGFSTRPYMVQIGVGEIGLLAERKEEVVVLVLDRESSGEWSWRKVSTLPKHLQKHMSYPCDNIGGRRFMDCCTHGQFTFLSGEFGLVIFDSQRLTWEWVEAKGKGKERYFSSPQRPVVLVPDLAAVPNLNTPSKELKKKCASRDTSYRIGGLRTLEPLGNFSGLEALSKRGMSWQEIGKSTRVNRR